MSNLTKRNNNALFGGYNKMRLTSKVGSITVIIASTIFALGIGCSKTKHKGGGGSASPDVPNFEKKSNSAEQEEGNDNSGSKTNATEDNAKKASLDKGKIGSVTRFKGMRELDATYASLTGQTGAGRNTIVDQKPNLGGNGSTAMSIAAVFGDVKSSLPQSTSIKDLTPAGVSAATKLAAAYCISFSQNAQLIGQALGTNLGALDPGAAATGLDISEAADALITAFWPSDMSYSEELVKGKTEVMSLMQTIAGLQFPNGNQNRAAQIKDVILAGCTVALSSPIVAIK